MNTQVILETDSQAAMETEPGLCCGIDYRKEFPAEELSHIPDDVLDRNYGCGVPTELRRVEAGKSVLDLGPGLGRDCFIASRRVGPSGSVFGLDMNDEMLAQARHFQAQVARRLGYDNIRFMKGQFDVAIPLEDESIDVILSNCVNNLAVDKKTAYQEMFRVLKPGSKLSFSDITARHSVPEILRHNQRAWADCVAGVLSYPEIHQVLAETGFHGITLRTDYLWKTGHQVIRDYFSSEAELSSQDLRELVPLHLYSVTVEAFKPVVDPNGNCFWRGQRALYHGPGTSFQLDNDPDHVFKAGEFKEVCEKTAAILKSAPFRAHFTLFEPEGEVESRACVPGGTCC
ncbi:MAG: methyltransferase domain-containing protein [Acidobacteriota bacterium]